jgi:Spy/CpxP family protein refolding chaperone
MMLLAGAPAFAQTGSAGSAEHEQMRQERMEGRIDQLVGKLGLDAAGAARLRQTIASYQAQLGPLHKEQWQTRKALKDELAAAQPNAAKLSQLTDELAANRQKMQAIEAQRAADLKQQLTPQQFAQLVVSRREMGREFHKHMRGAHR